MTFEYDPIFTIVDDEDEEDSDGVLLRVGRQAWIK